MNIYATGMNPADCNALKRTPRVSIFQAFGALMGVLKERGHTLTWQRTQVGDELPVDTDAVIVSSMLPRSLNCPFALGVMWTMSEALRRNIPLVIYLTDWAFFSASLEFKSIAKAGMPYFSKLIGGKPQYNEPMSQVTLHGEELLEICRQYAHGGLLWEKAQVLVPKYTNWGDMKIVKSYLPHARSVLPMDPTPVFVQYLLGENQGLPVLNNRGWNRWLLPSLLNNDTWIVEQDLKWPIDRYGPKDFPIAETERGVQELYRQRAGSLCPPYPTAGSGWWRSRWIHAAIAGSVLLCDSKDDSVVGQHYKLSGEQYETISEKVRKAVATGQREDMWNLLVLDKEVMAQQIYEAFQGAGAF